MAGGSRRGGRWRRGSIAGSEAGAKGATWMLGGGGTGAAFGHLTGGIKTHDNIVFGTEDHEARKRENRPVLRARMTSKLGAVTRGH